MKIEGLSEKQQKEFAASDDSKANIGDVESSYAFQRMTTNLVTGKQKRNAELEQVYNMTVRGDASIRSAPAESAAPVAAAQKGTRMKVIAKKGDQVQVRDEMGNEGWLPATQMVAH